MPTPNVFVSVTEPNESITKESVLKLSDHIKKKLGLLEDAKLLTRANFDLVKSSGSSYDEYVTTEYLEKLHMIGWLNQDTFEYIWKNRDIGIATIHNSAGRYAFCEIVKILHAENQNLLSSNIKMLLVHPNLNELWYALELLQPNKLIVNNFSSILLYKNPTNVGALVRDLTNSIQTFINNTPLQPEGRAPLNTSSTEQGLYTQDNDFFWQLKTGLPHIIPILKAFTNENLLDQTQLNTILAHQFPVAVKAVLEALSGTKISLANHLVKMLHQDEVVLEHLAAKIRQLKSENILNQDTFELAWNGYFNNEPSSERGKIKAVGFLIKNNLFTPLNLNFVDKGHFLLFDNKDKGIYYDWEKRAELLKKIQTSAWISSSIDLPWEQPKLTNSAAKPLPKILNELFKTTTEYLYKTPKQRYIPLAHELLLLQQNLHAAYSSFEKDGNVVNLKNSFQTHIATSRSKIEHSCSFSEKLQELFNKLLNIIQYVCTLGNTKDSRPWGRFFSQGNRALLVADLSNATDNMEFDAEENSVQLKIR